MQGWYAKMMIATIGNVFVFCIVNVRSKCIFCIFEFIEGSKKKMDNGSWKVVSYD